jgi:hypothetical protein
MVDARMINHWCTMDAISIYIDVQICMFSYILQLNYLSTCFFEYKCNIYIYLIDTSEDFWKMTLPLPKMLLLRATLISTSFSYDKVNLGLYYTIEIDNQVMKDPSRYCPLRTKASTQWMVENSEHIITRYV